MSDLPERAPLVEPEPVSHGSRTGLSAGEVRALIRPSDAAGAWVVVSTWAVVGAACWLLAHVPHPLTFAFVVVVLGGRQLALAVAMHEAAHGTLFRSRRWNDRAGDWLCGRPVWSDLGRYRRHHLRHHAYTGTARDPDLALITPFPTSRRSLTRKLLRDVSGATGVRRVLGLLAMDLGYLEYTVAGEARPRPRAGRSFADRLREAAPRLGGVVVTNLVLAGALAAAGIGWTYAAWVVAYLTTFSLFLRIRSLAEHACTERVPDMLRNTRTTHAGWLARATVAPLNVHRHLEHHLLPTVPWFRLGRLHRALRAKGVVGVPPTYADVLGLVSAG